MKPFQAQPQHLANKNSLKQVDKVHTVTSYWPEVSAESPTETSRLTAKLKLYV